MRIQRRELRHRRRVELEPRTVDEDQMRLDVRRMILLLHDLQLRALYRGHVLRDGVGRDRFWRARQDLIGVVDAQQLQRAARHRLVVPFEVRMQLTKLVGLLQLGVALGLAEDVRITDGLDIVVFVEVLGAQSELLQPLLVRVLLVEAADDLQRLRLRGVEPRVDGREDLRSLLDQRQRRSDRHRVRRLGDLLLGRRHHAACLLGQPLQQVEQHGRRRVERQRHDDLADVVDTGRRLHLLDLGLTDLDRLARGPRPLELERSGRVVNVGRVEQGAHRAGRTDRQRSDEVPQPDAVRTAPRDELVLDPPVDLLELRVTFLPVAVDGQDLLTALIDVDDVGTRTVVAFFQLAPAPRLVDDAQAVLVVTGLLAPFHLVAGGARSRRLGLGAFGYQLDVAVEAAGHPLLELVARD